MPLNSNDVLSSHLNISFFPANGKKSYKIVTLSVCLSVSLPRIEPYNNLTDLHVRILLKTTWPRRTSETTAPLESGHETKFLDSEDEGSTVLRNYRSRYCHYAADR